ncbi:hypothetical protein [Haemophilus haemolyticus]|uniref:hypothetical protein n=1 Tax=Haemophilus haemolyticus TaxID=726 RepID=UPI000E5774C7|nr:hypothetical protein [Haemophilus haemolyticus]
MATEVFSLSANVKSQENPASNAVLGRQVRLRKRKKFMTYRGTIGHIAPNRFERNFTITAPNQKWVTVKQKMGYKSMLNMAGKRRNKVEGLI